MNRGRREFVLRGAGALAGAFTSGLAIDAWALSSRRPVRVGILGYATPERLEKLGQSLVDGLAEFGVVSGSDLAVTRQADRWPGNALRAAARQYESTPVDVIITACGGSTAIAVEATRATPIVMGSVVDPVGRGFIRSFARPGTNVTGTAHSVPDLAPKMIEHFHLAFPERRRVGAIYHPGNALQPARLRETADAATARGITLVPVEVSRFATPESAATTLAETRVDGLLCVPGDDEFRLSLHRVIAAARAARIPTFFDKSDVLDTGATMSFGPDTFDVFRRSARYVDAIVKGAAPAELAVELPAKTELAISLRQAESIGVVVSRSALLRADMVVR